MLVHCASIISRFPLRVLYWFADWILYPLMYHIVRYRRRIVAKNLRQSFPDWKETRRKEIERAFYHQLCDTFVESFYGYRCPEEEMRKRVVFQNTEEVNRLIDAAGGGIFMLAHMGNWEWQACIQRELSPGVTELNVYRRLKNKSANRLMLALRGKRGGQCVEKQQILREMLRYRAAHQPVTVGLLSDQKPRPAVTRTWLTFLNQETGFLDGGEVLSKKFGYPVFYGHIRRPRRGYYVTDIRVLSATPQETAEGEITAAYARALEQNIKEQPELWLWSHNRWKYGNGELRIEN